METLLKELIVGIKKGEPSALEKLVLNVGPMLFSFVFRILYNHQDTEDVLQETFTIIFKKAGQKNPTEGSARSWIYSIAKNEALRVLRKRKADKNPDDSFPRGEQKVPTTTGNIEPEDIDQALKSVPIDLRIPFLMKECLDLTYEEISLLTDKDKSLVAQEIFRARKLLRETLEKHRT
ncbi:MAG: RNA polymerase sigma factor [Candidatus Riflebacteria bacterium]|nr:RNA polymerase sigma factor [Candidatus Riflebacteria bacterium]